MTPTRSRGARSARERTIAAFDALPLLLVVVAEAAWIFIVMGLVQEYVLRRPVLGLPAIVTFVALGVVAARLLGPRLGNRWPFAALGLAVVGAGAGWLASAETWAALGRGDLGRALATHPGGWLAGVAVVRGFAHASLPLAEATVARLLAMGIPALAIIAALGGLVSEPWRTGFLSDALVASIVFVATGTLGLAFVRLGAESGAFFLAWRRNPAWAGLLAVLVVTAVWVAIPASTMTGTAISWFIGLAMGPLLVLGLIATFQRPGRRILALAFAAGTALVIVGQIIKPGATDSVPPGGTAAGSSSPTHVVDQVVAIGLGGLGLLLAALAVIVLARLWMRRVVAPLDDAFETRSIDLGTPIVRARRRRAGRRRSTPVDAVGAYLALIDDLASRPAVQRDGAETPGEHARRLRRAGWAGLSLELLAADYALARYGGIALSEAEDRRAIDRWRRLRLDLGRGEAGATRVVEDNIPK